MHRKRGRTEDPKCALSPLLSRAVYRGNGYPGPLHTATTLTGALSIERRGGHSISRLTGQGLCWAIAAAYEVKFTEILGIRPLMALLGRAPNIAPEPEAQGPSFDGHNMRVYGPFRWSRHPLNLAPVSILWFNPRMTTNLLAFNLVSTAYLVIGSMHEEIRLFNRYGQPYRVYQRGGVNFYLPELPRTPQARP